MNRHCSSWRLHPAFGWLAVFLFPCLTACAIALKTPLQNCLRQAQQTTEPQLLAQVAYQPGAASSKNLQARLQGKRIWSNFKVTP